jgi:Rps23 Pro-64 3,4-dihydroxylase Tpa1-like proline 4-hydroxylase
MEFVVVIFLWACLASSSVAGTTDETFSFNSGTTFATNLSNQEIVLPDVLDRFTESRDNIQSCLKFRYETLRGKRIYVFDNLFARKALKSLQLYIGVAGWWRFVNADPYHSRQEVVGDNIQWVARFGAVKFANTRVGVALRQAIQLTSGNTDVPYYPFEVTCKLVRRGDDTKLHVHANESDDEYTTVIYLNDNWKKNDYGDMLLFDEEMEIVAPVKPNIGRTIVWHSSVPYLSRPPSIAFRMGQKILFIRWTTNTSKVMDYENQRIEKEEFIRKGREKGFALHSEPPESVKDLNIAEYETAQYATKKGQKIFVFDGLFNETELAIVRSYIIDYGRYYYDDSLDHDSDNVQWISGYKVDAFVSTKFWGIVHQVATYVSGGWDGWYPYDVSCNLIRVTDYTRIHLDCDESADEWTFLLYLNPNWGENDYGETAFFETNTDDTELVTEVRPRYGRVCIFDGTIPHSARPPSPRFTGGRYTLAVKMASSKFRASANLFREISQHEDGLKSVERFLTVLEQGKLTESVDKYMYRVPSEQHLNKLERGIMLDKEDEDEDDKDEEDNGFDEDNADDDGFHDEPEQPGSTQFSKEEQETIAFLEGDEEDYHKHVDRIVQSSNGDEEAIARAIANSDNNFDQTSERIKNRLEALI